MLIIEVVKQVINPESRFTIFSIRAVRNPAVINPMKVSN